MIGNVIFDAGGGPEVGGGVRRARARTGDRGRARAGRGGLEEQHRVPRRVPRRAPSHHLVLAGYRQVSYTYHDIHDSILCQPINYILF